MSTYPPGTYTVTLTGHWTDGRDAATRHVIRVTTTAATTADQMGQGAARLASDGTDFAAFQIDTVTVAS